VQDGGSDNFDLDAIARQSAAVDQAIQAVRAEKDRLMQMIQASCGGTVMIPPEGRFEVRVGWRSTWMTPDQIEALKPEAYSLFLDRVLDRFSSSLWNKGTVGLGSSGLSPRELKVLEALMVKNTFTTTRADLQDAVGKTLTQNEMAKIICNLRDVLGDRAEDPKLIVTVDQRRTLGEEPGYHMQHELKLCVIREIRRR
jgi:hypothetical protein